MKEQIYTIPVNEAYDIDCECPLCELEKKLEFEAVEYTLGAAMMEPDFRIISNEQGYCSHHYSMLFDMPNKLPLALILETHLEELRKKLGDFKKKADTIGKSKGGMFKKGGENKFSSDISDILNSVSEGCVICDKINCTMEHYADVLLYMWAKDNEFKEKFDKSKGVCLKHMKLLCDMSQKSLSKSQSAQFLSALFSKQLSELERIQAEIHRFTLKFDYRNKDMDWGNAQDAPIRTIEKISGFIKNNYDAKNNKD